MYANDLFNTLVARLTAMTGARVYVTVLTFNVLTGNGTVTPKKSGSWISYHNIILVLIYVNKLLLNVYTSLDELITPTARYYT